MGSKDESVELLFDEKLLHDLPIAEYGIEVKECDSSSYLKPDEGLILRPLSNKDFQKGFVDVLNQLTVAGDVTEDLFQDRFKQMKKSGCNYPIVVEDTEADSGRGRIVATGMLIVEQKFIHTCATRGRVEEIVVDKGYRKRKLGKLVLGTVTALSYKLGCYKTTLECATENLGFYQMFGYVQDEELYMQKRFRD